MTRAVLFDVDFTLIYPGPTFQGEGYRAFSVRHGIDVVVDDTTRHLKEAIAQGSIPDADPYFLAHGITTITLTFVRRFLHRGSAEGTVDPAGVGRAAVEFCLHGIGLAPTPE